MHLFDMLSLCGTLNSVSSLFNLLVRPYTFVILFYFLSSIASFLVANVDRKRCITSQLATQQPSFRIPKRFHLLKLVAWTAHKSRSQISLQNEGKVRFEYLASTISTACSFFSHFLISLLLLICGKWCMTNDELRLADPCSDNFPVPAPYASRMTNHLLIWRLYTAEAANCISLMRQSDYLRAQTEPYDGERRSISIQLWESK